MSSSVTRSLPSSQTRVRASLPATWKTARQPTLASRVSRMVRERSSSLARLWVARMNEAPNLPSSESIDS